MQVIRWSINTTSENVGLVCECEIINTKQTIDRDTIFYVKTQIGKTTGKGRRKINYNSQVYRNYRYVLVSP